LLPDLWERVLALFSGFPESRKESGSKKRKMRERRLPGCLLIVTMLLATCCCRAPDDDTVLEKLRAAEEELDRFRERVEMQEQLVDGLERLGACDSQDRECRRKPMQAVHSAKRRELALDKQLRDKEPLTSRLKKTASFEALSGATIISQFFLPFQDNNAIRDLLVNKFQIALDSKVLT